MQALFLKKNTKSHEHSFFIREAIVPHMYNLWHYHQEIEINLVLKGTGTRFVGNHIENFEHQDLVLIGANLPHVWINDPKYFAQHEKLRAHVINLQFQEDFTGKELINLPEFRDIRELIGKSDRGIRFYGDTYEKAAAIMQEIIHLNGFERLMHFLSLLNLLAVSKEYYFLSNEGFNSQKNPFNKDKINKIYDFVLRNYTEDITVNQVATIACMNPAAFCRFFKQTTHKTFVTFLNEVRIGHACKLLLDPQNLTISSICYDSGFKNLSNFNRQFKLFTGKTPNEYKKEYLEKLT